MENNKTYTRCDRNMFKTAFELSALLKCPGNASRYLILDLTKVIVYALNTHIVALKFVVENC